MLTSISYMSFSWFWGPHGEMWNLMLQMKLQPNLEIISSYITSPAILRVIWLSLIQLGAFMFFGNNNRWISRKRQFDMLKSDFWGLSTDCDDSDIFLKEIFAYFKWRYIRYFCASLMILIAGRWRMISFSNSRLKTFSVG